jgi:hypothetical protein
MQKMTMVRRFLLLMAVMFWHGGFTFHGAVVIHVGKEMLGSHLKQGFITGASANYLNLAGAVVLTLWAWDIAGTRDSSKRLWLRWAIWAVLVVTLGLLAWLHLRLDDLLVADSFHILDRSRFRELHRWYLNISTLQWGGSILLVGLTLFAWRSEDKKQTAAMDDGTERR